MHQNYSKRKTEDWHTGSYYVKLTYGSEKRLGVLLFTQFPASTEVHDSFL